MRQVRIVTDSNCHIPPALRQELGIRVVQLPYVWEGVTYLDELDIGPREFYSRLRASDSLPTTSAPTPGSFREAFEELASDGDPLLVIHVGSEFSSTYKTAELARGMLPEKEIRLFDSHSNALGLGFQVLAAARAANKGASLDEVLAVADQARVSTGLMFAVQDVSYLHRGGRMSFGRRFLASSLHLIPIMEIHQGPIRLVGTARGKVGAMSKLVERVRGRIDDANAVRLGILHADNESGAFELKRIVQDSIQHRELILQELNPVLGIHTGAGALGLAYCAGV